MEKILIFIKHHFSILWKLIEWGNGFLFMILFKYKMEKILPDVFNEFSVSPFSYRRLNSDDMIQLYDLIKSQPVPDLDFFHPHEFDLNSLQQQLRKNAFLMMGTFSENKLVGYFFLRFFLNKKCFVGRLIDVNYRGREIGRVMNNIMYETAWRMNFRCLSTISRHNTAVMWAHLKNTTMVILKELQNDYLLVEFIKNHEGNQ
ncbi:MAG: hypothetical protein MUO72_10005 [Bacteroidales bacterium]|nr:hypothetical protein [Bacteroidales bacterium]